MPGSRPCQPSSGCSASGVGRRDVGFLAFAVGKDAGLRLDALGFHVRGLYADGKVARSASLSDITCSCGMLGRGSSIEA